MCPHPTLPGRDTLEGTPQPRRPNPPPSLGLLSSHLQTPPLGGDTGARSNNLLCSSGVSFPEPWGGGWGWVWLCWNQFSIFILHTQSWAPRAEVHVEPGALVLSQTEQQPTPPRAARASHILSQTYFGPCPQRSLSGQVLGTLVQIQALIFSRHVTSGRLLPFTSVSLSVKWGNSIFLITK